MINGTDEQEKAVIQAFLHIQAHSLLNLYVCENLAFGKIKPNEKVPFERYFKDLGLERSLPLVDFTRLDGDFIVNGCAAEKSFDEVCFYLFREKVDIIFSGAPVDRTRDYDGDITHYKYGLYGYLRGVYPLFKRVMLTEITPDPFAVSMDFIDWNALAEYYKKASKLVAAVWLRGLRQGGRVERYIKDIPYLSPALERLVTVRNGRYYLKNSDTDSLDYKLALLSCFKFFNTGNAKTFELKSSCLKLS